MQLVQEFKVALCIGRKLVFGAGSADVQVSMKRTIQCREASGVMFDLEVDLLFPGEARNLLMLCYWQESLLNALVEIE